MNRSTFFRKLNTIVAEMYVTNYAVTLQVVVLSMLLIIGSFSEAQLNPRGSLARWQKNKTKNRKCCVSMFH